jgi:6-phosphogluconolactonase
LGFAACHTLGMRISFRWIAVWSCLLLQAAAGAPYIAYIGTGGGARSKGIYAFRFDTSDGKLTPLGLVAEAPRASFVAVHPNRKFLYAVAEERGGAVSAFAIDSVSGKLTLLNTVSSKGSGPCYVRVDKTGRNVLVANYGSGSVAVLPIGPDGKLRESVSFAQHEGTVADLKRQGKPRAHSFNPSPDNRFAVAADLGLDELLVYKFDAVAGTITPNDPPFAKVAPRSGPRHFAFHPKGKLAYSINEINCTVTSFTYDAKKGVLREIQTVSTLPAGVTVTDAMSTAEVQVHPSGKFLYGSNRGHDTIAVFSIAGDGRLTLLENISTQGKIPRNFSVDPSGKFLLAANQDTDTIVVFRIDPKTGRLTPTGQTVSSPVPICIKFVAVK